MNSVGRRATNLGVSSTVSITEMKAKVGFSPPSSLMMAVVSEGSQVTAPRNPTRNEGLIGRARPTPLVRPRMPNTV